MKRPSNQDNLIPYGIRSKRKKSSSQKHNSDNIIQIPDIVTIKAQILSAKKLSPAKIITTPRNSTKNEEIQEIEKLRNKVKEITEKNNLFDNENSKINEKMKLNDNILLETETKLHNLQIELNNSDCEISLLRDKLINKKKDYEIVEKKENEKFSEIEKDLNLVKNNNENLGHEKAEILTKVKNLENAILDSKQNSLNLKNSIDSYKNMLIKISELKIQKNIEIAELQKLLYENTEKLNQIQSEYEKNLQKDIKQEYIIHRMKGKLYKILILNYQNLPNKLIKLSPNQVEISQKSENIWKAYKFDAVLLKLMIENFESKKSIFELCENMLKFGLGLNETKLPDEIKPKEISYFCLSLKNDFINLCEFIDFAIQKIQIILEKPDFKFFGKYLETNSDSLQKKLNNIGEIRNFIMTNSKFQSNISQNKLITIEIIGYNLLLKFVIIDSLDTKNIDFFTKKAHEAKRSKTPQKILENPLETAPESKKFPQKIQNSRKSDIKKPENKKIPKIQEPKKVDKIQPKKLAPQLSLKTFKPTPLVKESELSKLLNNTQIGYLLMFSNIVSEFKEENLEEMEKLIEIGNFIEDSVKTDRYHYHS